MSLGDQSAHSTRSCEGGRGHVGRWGGPRPPRTPPFPAFFLRGPRRPLAPPGGRDANSDCRRPPQGGGARSSLAFRSMRCPPSRREGPSAGRRPDRRGVRRSGGLGPSSSSRPRILGPIGTSILWGGGARARARPSSPWGQPAEISALRGRAALAAHPGVRKPREPRGSAGPNTSRERAGARCGPPPCPTVLLHARSGARAPAPGASVGRRWDPTYRPLAGASVTPAALPAWVADFFSSGLPGRRPRPPPRRVATFEGHREARGEGGPEGARPVWLPPSFFGVGRGTGGKKSSERAPAPALLPDSPGCHPEHRGMRGERGPREVPRGSRRPPLALPPSLSLSPAGFDPQPPGGGV